MSDSQVMTEKKKGLFHKLYGAGESIKNAMKKPIVKDRLQRKLHSAYDHAEEQIIDALSEIEALRGENNFDSYDVNKIMEKRVAIKKLRDAQGFIREEYLELFGKEMPMKSPDEDSEE